MIRTTPRELVLYGGASACAFAVDVILLLLLTRVLDVHYLAAATVAFIVGAVVAYKLCITLVFEHRRLQHAQSEFGLFFIIGVLGLAANAGVLAAGVELLALPLLTAKVAAAAITGFLNYALRKLLLFTRFSGAPFRPVGTLEDRR